ncbi:MAG: T9SS type A sorting domain-containing protein [Prevotella sp.]|nr:T9SS type A sorting domain-containing protein [Prevotella sp.]
MKHIRLYIISAMLCSLCLVQTANATAILSDPIMNFMPDDTNIRMEMEQNAVSVYGAQGQMLEVVSITGKQVLRVKIDSASQRIELNVPKGCYILKIGSVVRKVSIR